MRTLPIVLLVASSAPPVAAQCGIVADLTPGTVSNNIGALTSAFGNELYFAGTFPTTGGELWKWDAAGGARMVVDLAPGAATTRPEHITACCTPYGPRVFFSGFEIGRGHELYASDGTAAGTGRVLEIEPGSGSSLPFDFCPSGERVFFNARNTTFGEELWISDGTAAGTQRLSDFAPGAGNGRPDGMVPFGDGVVFSAYEPTTGREVYISDGTPQGTRMVRDIQPGATGSTPEHFTRVGAYVYFVADDGVHRRELWRTDGTSAGTTLVADLFGQNSVGPDELCACGNRLFFREWTSGQLFATDGTAAGTVNLGVLGREPVCSGNRVFFRGNRSQTGDELWVSDGTVAGTQLVADLAPGSANSSPAKLVACGRGVCFVAWTATLGEIWFSDGTAAGTTLLCTLDPAGNANPDRLVMCRGRVFMVAYSPIYGRELFGIATPGATQALLGEGGRPDRPALWTRDGGAPQLGTTVDLEGSGPQGHVGAVLAGGPALPAPTPSIPGLIHGGCDWVGLLAGTAVSLAIVPASPFRLPLAVPNDAALEGVILQLQTVWFHPTASPMLQVSNGLQLGLGPGAPH